MRVDTFLVISRKHFRFISKIFWFSWLIAIIEKTTYSMPQNFVTIVTFRKFWRSIFLYHFNVKNYILFRLKSFNLKFHINKTLYKTLSVLKLILSRFEANHRIQNWFLRKLQLLKMAPLTQISCDGLLNDNVVYIYFVKISLYFIAVISIVREVLNICIHNFLSIFFIR